MFDWAAQPVFTIITTFVFAPYFAARVANDTVTGQAQWGYAAGLAGLIIALASPVFGSLADRTGRRKPWIALFSLVLVAGCALLWTAEPGGTAPIWLVLAAFVLANIGAEFATVSTNALLPHVAPPGRLGWISGAGWAPGSAGGLVSLFLVLGFLVAAPGVNTTILGFTLPFDPATGAGERATGPLSALWYLVFVLPLFLFTPDRPATAPMGAALAGGFSALKGTLRDVAQRPTTVRFLIARMFYADALAGLGTFGGIYAASIFGWGTMELGVFGIVLTVSGVFGALVGGWLDDRLGPLMLIRITLVILILVSVGLVSVTSSHVGFVIPVDNSAGIGLFSTPGEKVYLGLGLVLGAIIGPIQAASRTLLVKLSPPERQTAYFGLFALSGKATTWAAPLLVAIVTSLTGSQQIGIGTLFLFGLAGLAMLMTVRSDNQS